MPQPDEEFLQQLQMTFKAEAQEHLQAISSILMELEKSPPQPRQSAIIETIYREAHSLKGAARAVDLSDIEAICQTLEGVFASWKRQQVSAPPETFDTLHHALDAIRDILIAPRREDQGDSLKQREDVIQLLDQLPLNTPVADSAKEISLETPGPGATPALPQTSPPLESDKPSIVETLRIAGTKLDALLLQAEDMLVVKTMAVRQAASLRQVTTLFDQWRKEWAKVAPEWRAMHVTNHAETPDDNSEKGGISPALVDFLDWNCQYIRSQQNRLVSLLARMEQDCHGVAKRVDDLLEESKKLLMLPFASLADMLPKIVRDLCRDQGKEADLSIQGGEVEMDKRILDEMKDAMIHILRNCVDHGVELPAERVRLQKPARASITIAVSRLNDNKVEILISDDGAGVNVPRVKNSAIRHGFLSEAEARTISDAEVLPLIFHSEVSTSPVVTAISGRGLGMAIVRAKAEKLGGRISLESQPDAGTALRIVLPVTLATFRGILVTAADRTFVVPSLNVERVLRIKREEIRTVENREVISLRGKALSLARLDAVLGLHAKPRYSDASALLSVAILHCAQERIAFIVDEVLFEEEVLVKPLRRPLARIRNIAGATIASSGKVVPVLNIADLMKSTRKHGIPPSQVPPEKAQKAQAKKILVAEDSITSRMLLKHILESAAYDVTTAVDGLDAFTALRENHFDLVVSDVEMPRLNGFDLAMRIRSDKRLSNLPIILVTALESRQERERGIDSGANAYIIKSSFDQSDLLQAISRLI